MNREKDADRWIFLKQNLDTLAPHATRVKAVEETNRTEVLREVMVNTTNPKIRGNSFGALGCSLSHLKSVRLAYERNDAYALFLEDDVLLDLWPFWTHSISEYVASLPPDWDASQLGRTNPYAPTTEADRRRREWKPWRRGTEWGTFAFLLSRKGIQKVYDYFFDKTNKRINFNEMEKKCRKRPIIMMRDF